MTYEEAIKILEVNVIWSLKATQFKEAVEAVTNEINRQKAENERLQIRIGELIRQYNNDIVKAKNEAIKQFAEKLHIYINSMMGHMHSTYVKRIQNKIKTIVKEMEGK